MQRFDIGDKVRHKKRGFVGVIYSFEKYGLLIDWSDKSGVCFRLVNPDSLEHLNAKI
jgi:heat shock protein HspQ